MLTTEKTAVSEAAHIRSVNKRRWLTIRLYVIWLPSTCRKFLNLISNFIICDIIGFERRL